jgi:hypothetical protein
LRAAAETAGIPLSLDFARAELGRTTPQRTQRTTPVTQLDPFFQDEEKVVWTWDDPSALLIEEFR